MPMSSNIDLRPIVRNERLCMMTASLGDRYGCIVAFLAKGGKAQRYLRTARRV